MKRFKLAWNCTAKVFDSFPFVAKSFPMDTLAANSTEFIDILSASAKSRTPVDFSPLSSATKDSDSGSPPSGPRLDLYSFNGENCNARLDGLSRLWRYVKGNAQCDSGLLCSKPREMAGDSATMSSLSASLSLESATSSSSCEDFAEEASSLTCESAPIMLPGIDELVDSVVEEDVISPCELREWASRRILKERSPAAQSRREGQVTRDYSELGEVEKGSLVSGSCGSWNEKSVDEVEQGRGGDDEVEKIKPGFSLNVEDGLISHASDTLQIPLKGDGRERAFSMPAPQVTAERLLDMDEMPTSLGNLNDPASSFSESFARRKRAPPRNQSCYLSAQLRFNDSLTEVTAQAKSVAEFMRRAGKELAELLDQSPRTAHRLTVGTRLFENCFTFEEKRVFGAIVRAAMDNVDVDVISVSPVASAEHSSGLGHWKLTTNGSVTSSHDRHQSEEHKLADQVGQSSLRSGGRHALKMEKIASIESARRAVFGSVSVPHDQSRRTSLLHRKLSSNAGDHEASQFLTRIDPLIDYVSNEKLEVQLPFGSALLVVLAVLARIDCDLIHKKRKNKNAPFVRNLKSRHSATIYVHTRSNEFNRPFIFSVVVTGSTSTKIAFRRPLFLSQRLMDEYVDAVCDSKEYLAEYVLAMWGRSPH